jgi:hypothetical protein
LTCHHCQRANTMNNLLTYYILYRWAQNKHVAIRGRTRRL